MMDEDDEEREEAEAESEVLLYTTTSMLRGNKKRLRSIQHDEDEDDIQEDRFVRGRAEEINDVEGGEEAAATPPKLGVRNNAATMAKAMATGVESDELEEQRRKSFFEALEKHTTKKGITLPPLRLGKEDNVDLFELFVAVCLKGGFKGVVWSEIAAFLRLPPTINNAEIALKTFYAKYLYPFEIEVRLDSTAIMDELADPSTIQLGSTTINLMLLLESTMFCRSIAYQQQFKQPRPTRTPEHRQQQKLIAALGSGNETYIEWALNTLCQHSYVSDEMRLTTPVLLDHISVFIEKELTILETTPSSSIDYVRHLERATQLFKVINNLSCVTSNSIAMASHVPTMQMLLEVLSLRSSCTSSEEGLTGLLQNALEALVNVATHSSANELWLEYLDSLIHLLDSEFDDKKIDFIACELFYKLSLHDRNEFIFASISDTFLDIMLRFLEYKCLSTLPSSACVIRHNHQPSSCCTLPSHLGLLSLALLFNLSSHATLQKRLANHPNCLRRLIHLLQMVDEDTASDPVRLDLSKRAAFILFNISSNSETAELLSQFENELACVSISKHPYNRIALKILHQIQIT